MKYTLNNILILIFIFVSTLFSEGQEVKTYKNFDDFEPLLHKMNDTVYVVNFWATWCKPCIEELPYFQKLNQKYTGTKFKLILVSLDFENKLDTKLKPFIREHDIQAQVVLLADSRQYKWIDRVNKDWSGSIPITIIYNKDFYYFKEGSIDFDTLDKIITKHITK